MAARADERRARRDRDRRRRRSRDGAPARRARGARRPARRCPRALRGHARARRTADVRRLARGTSTALAARAPARHGRLRARARRHRGGSVLQRLAPAVAACLPDRVPRRTARHLPAPVVDAGDRRAEPVVARLCACSARARGAQAGLDPPARPRAPSRQRRRPRGGRDALPDPDDRLFVRRSGAFRAAATDSGGRFLMAEIVFEHVTKQFDESKAVDDLSIDVADGEFLVLVGPSGCGKTTALRMLAGLEDISSGRILIGDRVVNHVAPGARNVAMVFQSYALYPHMSVYDNLAFGLRNYKVPKEEITRRVNAAAATLELDGLLKRKPKQLSGGQRQRVALGRAIVREPEGFLMDEPLSNLDAALRVQTRAEILRLQKRLGTTTIYVTHDQVEAMTMGDRIAVMRSGVLQQIGTPEQIYMRPANTFVATFIGSPAMNLIPAPVLGLGADSLLAGFRPEHVRLEAAVNGSVGFDAEIEVVEFLGDEQLAHLRLGECLLVAKLPVDRRLEPGTAAEFAVAREAVSFFVAETGEATIPPS